MTYENCLIQIELAENEEDKKFWEDRTKRKYPEEVVEEVVKEVKTKKKGKK